MKRKRLVGVALCGGAAIACAALVSIAGPLDPPAGAVASTHKTLSEVEPRIAINQANTPGDPLGGSSPSLFKITQPGSYYLTGSIVGEVGMHGIELAASGVTLDLMGFDLQGVAGMGFFSGITVTEPDLVNVTVLNGSVRGWEGEAGVDLGGISFGVTNCRVLGVHATGNAVVGIRVGNGGAVIDCSAQSNNSIGISVLGGGKVQNCSATSNLASGISVGPASTVVDCVARLNALDGIRCSQDCVILRNSCSSNGNGATLGFGVHATGSRNRIEGNNCTFADRGIDLDGASNLIFQNSCASNGINYRFVAGNVFGPIIDRVVPTSSAVNGSSALDASGTTHPWANFSY